MIGSCNFPMLLSPFIPSNVDGGDHPCQYCITSDQVAFHMSVLVLGVNQNYVHGIDHTNTIEHAMDHDNTIN